MRTYAFKAREGMEKREGQFIVADKCWPLNGVDIAGSHLSKDAKADASACLPCQFTWKRTASN